MGPECSTRRSIDCRGLTADAADPEVVEPDRYQNCLTRVPTDS